MRKIGVITSGGDAPGMNAAIRAVVRTALARGVEVLGFYRGYEGILAKDHVPLVSTSVGGIINQGGTFLRTARSQHFRSEEGRTDAHANLKELGVEGLVVIGGDGSLSGALKLHEEFAFPVMGVPGSIDNDLSGTDYSIGFDTAVNVALEAIDRIRDTAYSHERVFVVEVMGRHNGFIALEAGIAGGAEAILLPEIPYSLPRVCETISRSSVRGKRSNIVIVAEGAARAVDVSKFIADATGLECRYLVLGHMQRGGSPTSFDRVLALRLASHATNHLIAGETSQMAGIEGTRLVLNSLEMVLHTERRIDPEKLLLAESMAN